MEQQSQQGMPIDLKNTEQIYKEDGGVLFKQGFILRKVSKFVTGGAKDSLMTVPVFYDPVTHKILEESCPPDILEDIKEMTTSRKEE